MILSFGNFRNFYYWFKMNQTIVSKRYSRHIRERRRCYRLSLSFSQAETGRRTRFARWRKLQRQQVQANLCTVKNCCEKMNGERWCRLTNVGGQADLITRGVRYFAGTAGEEIRFVFTSDGNETRNFESSVDEISTINYSWMRRTKGSSKRYPNDKDYQRMFRCVYVGGWKSVSSRWLLRERR